MPYLVYVKDKPDSLELRTELRPVHLEYLEANQQKLLAAGALLEDDGSGAHGGAVILDVEDRAAAEEFVRDDPFTKAGLFESVTITRWRKSFFDGIKTL